MCPNGKGSSLRLRRWGKRWWRSTFCWHPNMAQWSAGLLGSDPKNRICRWDQIISNSSGRCRRMAAHRSLAITWTWRWDVTKRPAVGPSACRHGTETRCVRPMEMAAGSGFTMAAWLKKSPDKRCKTRDINFFRSRKDPVFFCFRFRGTNQPSKLSFIATGLHASLTYSFRVYAENRVGGRAGSDTTAL